MAVRTMSPHGLQVRAAVEGSCSSRDAYPGPVPTGAPVRKQSPHVLCVGCPAVRCVRCAELRTVPCV